MEQVVGETGPSVGDTAPDFTLPAANTEADEVTLSEMVGPGHVVLAFFPLAFTGTCRKELCVFRDEVGAFHNADARVLGISCDSRMTLNEFARVEDYQFPLLSDWNREVVPKYAGFHDEILGHEKVPRRSVFLVDRDQTVAYRWVTDDPTDLPPFDEVVSALPGG